MALMTRVARLFRADMHAVLDRLEEPEVLLRQALREMEDCVDADRRRVALLAAEHDTLGVRARDLQRGIDDVRVELDVCLEAGNDELARTLLRRRLESQRTLTALARRREALDAERDTLARRVQQNGTRLESMRHKADVLAQECPAHVAQPACGDAGVSDHDVEIALLAEKRARSAP